MASLGRKPGSHLRSKPMSKHQSKSNQTRTQNLNPKAATESSETSPQAKTFSSLLAPKKHLYPLLIVFVVAMIFLGQLIVRSLAAIPYVAFEPEKGQLSGPIDIRRNSAASGGQYIEFLAPDNVAPTVSLTAPTPSASVSGRVNLVAAADDNVRVSAVYFYVDDVLKGSDTSEPYSIVWDASKLSTSTSHTIFAKAVDDVGLTKSTPKTKVTVLDGRGPTVSLANPANGNWIAKSSTVTVNAADNVAVTKVEIYIDGTLKTTDAASPYTYTWDTSKLANGTSHIVQAKAYDPSGNVSSSSPSTVIVDAIAPVVVLTAPLPKSPNLVSGTVTFAATAQDNTGISKVDFLVDNVVKGSDTTSPYNYAFNTKSLSDGQHTVKAIAHDKAKNLADSRAVSLTFENVPGRPDVVSKAASYLGWREQPLGSNNGPQVDVFTGNLAEPWCADFVSYVFWKTGTPFTGGVRGDSWRISYAYNTKRWMQAHGHWYAWNSGVKPLPGDIIVFDWRGRHSEKPGSNHVGFVEKVTSDNHIHTIEGNISSGVVRRDRGSYKNNSLIVGWGRQK